MGGRGGHVRVFYDGLFQSKKTTSCPQQVPAGWSMKHGGGYIYIGLIFN
jgi:hypothetical protein